MKLKSFLFYALGSFVSGMLLYYAISFIMGDSAFGAVYMMILYHYEYPLSYIAISSLVFGMIASRHENAFGKQTAGKRMLLFSGTILLVLIISSPLGGILWHLQDMQAGYFPDNWILKLLTKATVEGLAYGWFIILLSFPLNMLWILTCYALMEMRRSTGWNDQNKLS